MVDPKVKEQIDRMDYEEMLRKWRFAPVGDPMLAAENDEYFAQVMQEKRKAAGESAHVSASKNIGWGK